MRRDAMRGKFYVYEHWRPDRDECFYVGKGHGARANDMRRGRNRFHKFIQLKLSRLGYLVEVRLIAQGLTEEEAFTIEVERIAMWHADGADLANLTDGGEGSSGLRHTEEQKRAVSAKLTGRIASAEACAKLSAAAMGNQRGLGTKKSPEAIERTASAHRGKPKSAEHRAKISAAKRAQNLAGRHHHSSETIERIRARQIGVPKSEQTRARMRKPKSDAHKEKLRQANLGKTLTDATRELLSQKAKADWARRKAEKQRILENNSSSVK
jgi:hypothetical protein